MKRVFELQLSALHDYHKNLIGRILLLYDIDDQKKAIEELDAFSRTVAHDLKNPLANIIGFTDLIKHKVKLSDDQRNYIDNIDKSAEKMLRIIEGLLMLAKVRNKESIEITELNMSEIIDAAINRLKTLIEDNRAKIYKPDKWPIVLGDPVWIEEVWVNYLSNAIKYGGKVPMVELSAKEIKNFTQFSVKDNGLGLNKEEQSSLFVEFSRLQSINKT